ncbi:hypothetical protein N7526_011528 [Penicillium atrosanguineum]|nr:hypothetical protein N7526_011528 [Penicillium atrosanguineum]
MDYLDYIESQALPSVGVPEFSPSPIKKPGRKDNPEEKSLDGRCLPNQSIGDVWSYIPDCILKNWRRSQAIPGVSKHAPFGKAYAADMQTALCSSGHCSYFAITAVAGSKYHER